MLFKHLSIPAILLTAPLIAQSTFGGLFGHVADNSGKPIPDVEITLSSPKLAVDRKIRTDHRGDWRMPLLPLGKYTVVFQKQVYTRVTIKNLEVKMPDQYRFSPAKRREEDIYILKSKDNPK